MKRKNPKIKLDKYDERIKACSNEIKIKGTLTLDEFIIAAKDKKVMEEVSVLESAHISKYEVILGRDLMWKVEKLRHMMELTKKNG